MNVMTWNMDTGVDFLGSKWESDVGRLFTQLSGKIDVLLLQGVGTPPGDVMVANAPQWLSGFAPPSGLPWGYFTWNIGTSFFRKTLSILWVMADLAENVRNLAVVWDNSATPATNLVFVANPAGGLPSIGIIATSGSMVCNLLSIDTFAPYGDDASALLTAVAKSGNRWFAAGDFHRTPQSLGTLSGMYLCEHDDVKGRDEREVNNTFGANSSSSVNGTVFTEFVAPDLFSVIYPLTS